MISIDLNGKKALVTASSRGIGKGIATILSEAGAEVFIVSRDINRLREAAKGIEERTGNKVYFTTADLRSISDLEKLISRIREIMNSVDIFVFNTGGPKPGKLRDLEMEDWYNAVKLLIYPAVFLTKVFIEDMMASGWGRVIYSTSVAIKEPVEGLTLSNSIRTSLAGLVRTLAREYARFGITVNAIMPGYIETERVRELAALRAEEKKLSVEDVIKEMSKDIPAGRMGRAEEIGYLAAFLSSDYASYINGAIIPIDGGLLKSSL
jgi:3-oxoacyl-[acyl-carrier protein] reductase